MDAEIPDGRGPDDKPFGAQKTALQLEVAAVASKPAGRRHHPMTRHISLPAVAHDVADRPSRARTSRSFGHIAIRRDLADRNPANHGEDTVSEWRHGLASSFQFSAEPHAGTTKPQPRTKTKTLKHNSDPYTSLYAACLHRKTASLDRFEIDVCACVAHEATDADRTSEHPGDIDAGVEAGR